MDRQIYYYQIQPNQTIRLLRCFGENPCVTVPRTIAGLPVTEIGTYCFSLNGHLEGKKYEISAREEEIRERTEAGLLTEQCGRYITEVILPDTLEKLSAYAFYGCRSLKKLTLHSGLKVIENDAFMNCVKLNHLTVMGKITDNGCLRYVLAQIAYSVDVSFYDPENRSTIPDARLLYAEYYEHVEEVGPAHLFQMEIDGEGFRTRQAFSEGIVLVEEYDKSFPKLSVEEKLPVASRFCLNRLLYPAKLTPANREMYAAFAAAHPDEITHTLLEEKETEPELAMYSLEQLFKEHILDKAALEKLLSEVSDLGMAELAASLIKWKRLYFAEEKKKSRYSFDDF